MAGQCCDMFALVADREKQFPKHDKTCWNSLRKWICTSLNKLRGQILCVLLINLKERQHKHGQRSDGWQLCGLGPTLFTVMQLSPQPNVHQKLITPLEIQNNIDVMFSWHILQHLWDEGMPQSAYNPRQSLPKSQIRAGAFFRAASNDAHIQSGVIAEDGKGCGDRIPGDRLHF